MGTSTTRNQDEDRLNGHQARSYVQVVVRDPDIKDVEIRESARCVKPEGDVLMVSYYAADASDEDVIDAYLASAEEVEQREVRVQQPQNKAQ